MSRAFASAARPVGGGRIFESISALPITSLDLVRGIFSVLAPSSNILDGARLFAKAIALPIRVLDALSRSGPPNVVDDNGLAAASFGGLLTCASFSASSNLDTCSSIGGFLCWRIVYAATPADASRAPDAFKAVRGLLKISAPIAIVVRRLAMSPMENDSGVTRTTNTKLSEYSTKNATAVETMMHNDHVVPWYPGMSTWPTWLSHPNDADAASHGK
mmetsp:Transcript_16489/g.45036  ORF Transcript_16489/g.45036 Transcript_16489/m.45036 type:complete len:217 (+) Transcript_16489:185-835(+)